MHKFQTNCVQIYYIVHNFYYTTHNFKKHDAQFTNEQCTNFRETQHKIHR